MSVAPVMQRLRKTEIGQTTHLHGKSTRAAKRSVTGAEKCRRKFLRIFPRGFEDDDYLNLERNYKWAAHERWVAALNRSAFQELMERGAYDQIARTAITIEGRTHLIFSYEKMALRDAVKTADGARAFAEGLFQFLHGSGGPRRRFEAWQDVVAALPRLKSRVLTWPVLTVFGFVAQPNRHFYLKPTVMRRAAQAYGFDLAYASKPSWPTYASMLAFAAQVADDLHDLSPRDMIDIQSFLWVQGSDEY